MEAFLGTLLKLIIIFCTLYTDSLGGRTDAVARHVSIIQILVGAL